MVFLTQEERDKFATWLEQEAKSDDQMADQLNLLKGHDIMVKHMKQRAMMFSLISIELRKIEDG
jgi:hypothetical protein